VSTHVAAPAATPAAVFPAAPGWLKLSAAFGDEVPVIADRDDLVSCVRNSSLKCRVCGWHVPAGRCLC
jgi:hypothetical protein